MRAAVASLDATMASLSPERRPPVDVFTAFRMRTAVETFERELTPIAAANALLAYREHCRTLGVKP